MCKLCGDPEQTSVNHIEERLTINKLMGQFFGYPECCIEAFLVRSKKMMMAKTMDELLECGKIDPLQDGFHDGLLPCIECAKKVRPGEEYKLIQNRVCSKPYPYGSTYDKFDSEFTNFIIEQLKPSKDVKNISKNKKSVENHNG